MRKYVHVQKCITLLYENVRLISAIVVIRLCEEKKNTYAILHGNFCHRLIHEQLLFTENAIQVSRKTSMKSLLSTSWFILKFMRECYSLLEICCHSRRLI